MRGVYPRNCVYAGVAGWESFEPWLTRMETMDATVVWRAAEGIPPEWYGGDLGELEALVEKLLARRARLRELIEAFGRSDREPFPKWVGLGGRRERTKEETEKWTKMRSDLRPIWVN